MLASFMNGPLINIEPHFKAFKSEDYEQLLKLFFRKLSFNVVKCAKKNS